MNSLRPFSLLIDFYFTDISLKTYVYAKWDIESKLNELNKRDIQDFDRLYLISQFLSI